MYLNLIIMNVRWSRQQQHLAAENMTGIRVSFFQGWGQTCMYFNSLIQPLQTTELTFKVWAWEQFECCRDAAPATASFLFRCYSCNVEWWHNYDCSGRERRHLLINGVCTYAYINEMCTVHLDFGRNPTCLYKHAGKLILFGWCRGV